MDYLLQVITLSVSDVDKAAAFYARQAGGWQPGTDPQRRDYASFADFSDPDGNTWIIQEIGYRPPPGASGGRPPD